jgi:hypothetical protein
MASDDVLRDKSGREVLAQIRLGKYDWTTVLIALDDMARTGLKYGAVTTKGVRAGPLMCAIQKMLANQGMTIVLEVD